MGVLVLRMSKAQKEKVERHRAKSEMRSLGAAVRDIVDAFNLEE